MADEQRRLDGKIEVALNEARTLVLIVQILLGFQFRAYLEPGFPRLSSLDQGVKLASLGLQIAALALLLWPCAAHRFVDGHNSPGFLRFTSRVITVALLPFALALAADVEVAFGGVRGQTAGLAAGALVGLLALALWYGLELLARGSVRPRPRTEEREMGTELPIRIKQVLTETRVVVPGVQALLGFQIAGVVTDGFAQLPAASKDVHLASLALMVVSAILLMAPPAYHRIVEGGEDTERLHRFASRMLLGAMPPLALGIAGDVYVVVGQVVQSPVVGAASALATALAFLGLWFGLPLAVRARPGATDAPVPLRRRSRERPGIVL